MHYRRKHLSGVYTSVCLSISLIVFPWMRCLSVYLSGCITVYLYICVFMCLSIHLSAWLCSSLSLHLIVYQSICLLTVSSSIYHLPISIFPHYSPTLTTSINVTLFLFHTSRNCWLSAVSSRHHSAQTTCWLTCTTAYTVWYTESHRGSWICRFYKALMRYVLWLLI